MERLGVRTAVHSAKVTHNEDLHTAVSMLLSDQ